MSMVIRRSTERLSCLLLFVLVLGSSRGDHPPPVHLTSEQDLERTLGLLDIASLRRGPDGDPKSPNAANFDSSKFAALGDLGSPSGPRRREAMSSSPSVRSRSCSEVRCTGGGWSPREEPRTRTNKSRQDNRSVDRRITMDILREKRRLYRQRARDCKRLHNFQPRWGRSNRGTPGVPGDGGHRLPPGRGLLLQALAKRESSPYRLPAENSLPILPW